MSAQHPLRGESGMTLVELLIAMTVLGLIIGPLTGAMYLGLQIAGSSGQRTTDSADAQLASTYFASDVQGADLVKISGFTCPDASTLLELRIEDAGSGVVQYVAYRRQSAGQRLDRVVLDATCAEQERRTTVHNLDPSTPPAATCTPSADCARGTVSLQLSALNPDVHGGLYSRYDFVLTGTRRAA